MPRTRGIVADPRLLPNPTVLQEAPVASSSRHRPRRRAGLAAAVAVALATGGLALGVVAPASAAEPVAAAAAVAPTSGTNLPGAVTDIAVTPTTPEQGAQVTTTLDFTVPADAVAGDSFTVLLSPRLTNLPETFPVLDLESDAVVANAVVVKTAAAAGAPAGVRLVVTFTDFVQTHMNVSGSAFIESSFDSTTTPSGVASPFTSVVDDGRTFTTQVTPVGPVGSHLNASKYGVFTRADQGRTNPLGALEYRIDTPVGPFATATTTDTRPAGQTWTFACGSLSFQDRQADARGLYVPGTSKPLAVPAASVTCTPGQVTVTWPTAAAGHFYRLVAPVDLAAPTGTGAAQSFSNSAVTVLARTVGGTSESFPAQSVTRQASAGGEADGTDLPPVVTPPVTTPPVTTPPVPTPPVTTPPVTTLPAGTTPPAATTPVTTTPAATAVTPVRRATPAAASPTRQPSSRTSSDSSLAFTGDESLAPALIALLFATVGTALVVTAHRRARRG
ncbi:Ig-like domain-containing protein [Frigoribacterium sp. VKM Ac-2530]|uniref:Ig-like domain-containing protein n=1 Tax=Frigoribacterium sp. VKM Ac-2530 TaxID=2783822 RepID=UPI00188D5FAD|nr:Ig-like domain-containing protein [Frigoribacterium sp. VKM Ac-2530]MBF4580170.1 hypothetical protein [Frigoribacterium sp. VKM Ac-2530]